LLTKFGVLSGEVIISILFSVLLFLFKSKFGNYKIIGGILLKAIGDWVVYELNNQGCLVL
jgi:hypothetical protein